MTKFSLRVWFMDLWFLLWTCMWCIQTGGFLSVYRQLCRFLVNSDHTGFHMHAHRKTHNYGRITPVFNQRDRLGYQQVFCISTNIKNGSKLCLLITDTQLHVNNIIRGIFIFITRVNSLVGILSSSERAQMFCVCWWSVIHSDRIWEIFFRR